MKRMIDHNTTDKNSSKLVNILETTNIGSQRHSESTLNTKVPNELFNSQFAIRLVIISCLSLSASGYTLVIVNSSINYFSQALSDDLSREYISAYLNFAFSFSAFIASFLYSALFVDKISRVYLMTITDFLMIFGCMLTFLMTDGGWVIIITGRILCGI